MKKPFFAQMLTIFASCFIAFFLIGFLASLIINCAASIKSTNPPCLSTTATQEQCLTMAPSIPSVGTVSWTDAECKAKHNAIIGLTVCTAVCGSCAGGTAITTAALPEKTPKWVTGSISLACAACATVCGILQKADSDDFSTGCRVATEPAATSP